MLLCGWFDGSKAGDLTESTPLPAGTEIGIENFVDTLNLGLKGYGVSIGRRSGRKWGAVGALGQDYFALGSCWVSDGLCGGTLIRQSARRRGTTSPAWTGESLPRSMDEAKAMLDPSRWATPKRSPDPKDRASVCGSIRTRTAALSANTTNGTPLRVIAQGGRFYKGAHRQSGRLHDDEIPFCLAKRSTDRKRRCAEK